MKIIKFSDKHIQALKEYGLTDITARSCRCIRYDAGETITREGEPISLFAVVVSGRVKGCRVSQNGKSLTVCYYISEGMIGEIELLTGNELATTTVVAITDIECVAIGYDKCIEELKTNIKFSNKLGTVLAGKLSYSADSLVSSALYSGMQRLSIYILRNENRDMLTNILTEVSDSIGMSYRHMLRLLSELCEKGILEKRPNGYYIKNKDELLRLSREK